MSEKLKKNAGRRTRWDAKKGKTVQKEGRPKALKAGGSMEMMRKTKEQLVRLGTPAAKAELKRRERDPKGKKMAWSKGAKAPKSAKSAKSSKSRSTRRARHNPGILGRMFVRIPESIPMSQAAFNAMTPNVLYFVGPGTSVPDCNRKGLVIATYDFRMGDFGDPNVTKIESVRNEDEAIEKLRKNSYPRNKLDRYDGPYNLYQVDHDGKPFSLPTLLSADPFLMDKVLAAKRKKDKSIKQLVAIPYPYPYTAPSRPRALVISTDKKDMGVEQLVLNEVYGSGRDMSVPWRDAVQGVDGSRGYTRRTLVTKYFGAPKFPTQEVAITEGEPGQGLVPAFTLQDIERGLTGISMTLQRENPGVKAAMIEYCVLPDYNLGDIRINLVLWKSAKTEWSSEETIARVKTEGALSFGGYPPELNKSYFANNNPARRSRRNPEQYTMTSGIRAFNNPMEEIDIDEIDEEEALPNPRPRRSHRR